MIRTHEAGSLRAPDAGTTVTLAGWVARRRDHGGVIFVDLRDASGVVQVVFREGAPAQQAHALRNEFCVLVALPDEESRPACDRIAWALRARGIATEVAPAAAKYGKQIRFAERRGIPYVWFPGSSGGGDEVKDIRSGDQVAADAATWEPAPEDLRPQVIAAN